MLKLIRNENMKIYRRTRTWVLFLLLIGIVAFGSYQIHRFQPADPNWKQTMTVQNVEYEKNLKDSNLSKQAKEYYGEQLKINQYRLEHDIAPSDSTVWGNVLDMKNLVVLVTIFTVIIAADMMAGEFSQGTVKLLLIRPHSRSKVLLSKYLSALQFSLLLLLILFGASYGFGGLFNGFDGAALPHVYMSGDGVVHESNMLVHTLSVYGLACINLLMTVTLAFMISTVFRSSSLAIGLSMGVLLLSTPAVNMLKGYWWFKYYLFANTDLTGYLEGTPLRSDMTLTFSILVLVGYFVVMNVLSWTIFKKRDVAA